MSERRKGGTSSQLMILVAVLVLLLVGFRALTSNGTPSRDDPAAYTQHVVQEAIERYDVDGRDLTIAYYNTAMNVDGQWYVFIIDGDGYTIAHHNPDLRYRDPAERVDSTGYFYGDDLLAATEEGRWVSYVFFNPDTGEEQRKHTWAVRHDGLLFGSGWYEPAGS